MMPSNFISKTIIASNEMRSNKYNEFWIVIREIGSEIDKPLISCSI